MYAIKTVAAAWTPPESLNISIVSPKRKPKKMSNVLFPVKGKSNTNKI